MSRVCPSCGAPDYGMPFCVSCQHPLAGVRPEPDGKQPEAIEESVPVTAGFFRRLMAFALDWIVLSVIADIVSFAYRFGGGSEKGMMDLDAAMGLSAFLFFLYFTLLTGDSGQTLGKRVLGLRVVFTDGSPVTYGRALLRTLGYVVSSFFFWLGFLWVIWDRKNQGWHDKIAGTVVIKTNPKSKIQG